MKKQCAAVSTHCASMMVPPQMWTGPYCTLTCQGHLLTEVSFPPMIRPEILCPQAAGESRGLRGGKPRGCAQRIPTTAVTSSAQRSLHGAATFIALYYPEYSAGEHPLCPAHHKDGKKTLPSICLALPALVLTPCWTARLLVHRRETNFPVRHWELWERREGHTSAPA